MCFSALHARLRGRAGRWAHTLLLLGCVLGGLVAYPALLAASAPWGQRVLSTRWKCDANLRLEDFRNLITQKVGEPLNRSKVAQSLKALYGTGRFTDLRAEAEPGAGGVDLVFIARAQYFLGVVRVEGSSGPIESRGLVAASRLRLGQPFSGEALAAARQHIVESLAANGYHRAQVEQEVRRDPASEEADVVFSIKAGPPAHLSGVDFQGRTVFPPPRLAAVAGWHSGLLLTEARVERGLFRLRQFYVARDRLQALVRAEKRTWDSKLNTERLQVEAEAGPLVRVGVEGARIPTPKLRHLLPVFSDGVVDDPALARNAAALEGYFQQQGYFSATVQAASVSHPELQTMDLSFRVTLGAHGVFMGYAIKGNHSISTAELKAAVLPPVEGLLQPRPAFSHQLVERKSNTLATLYHAQGFLAARVSPVIDEEFEHQFGHWFVTFEISEGPRTTVRNLSLVGLGAGAQERLWPSLLTKPLQPFAPERALTDRDYLLSYLADRGYEQATVTWQATPVASQNQVDVEYHIEPGPQERIQRVLLVGDQHTRPGTIRRELQMRKGEPLSQADLLESQRRLYDLGTFNQVQITPQELPAQEVEKTVLVAVEEARRWTLGYGGGIEVQRLGGNTPQGQYKASPRLSLDVTRLDVGGRAQTLTLWGRLSDLEKGAGTGYVVPRLLGTSDLSLRFNARVDRTSEVLTFTDDIREVSMTLEKKLSASTVISTRYSFRREQALDISNRISGEDQFLLSQPALVGMVGGSFVNDHRDDPADSTRGAYTLADVGVATRDFGGEANFVRFTGQNATYHRLTKHLIFARKTQIGIETPIGGLRSVTVTEPGEAPEVIRTHEIPLPERFFMGGSESNRGFSINQAGPRDPNTGFPIGGNALFLNSFELRVPLAERRLGFVFFDDAGNVYSTVRRMHLLKFTQNSPTDLDYTVQAVGSGIRYKTPVGPLRFDVGYNLNPPRYQVITQTNGETTTEVQRLSRLQFFVSVGQSF